MENNEKDIRKLVQNADAEFHSDEAKEGMLRDVLVSSFRGQMKWASLIAWASILVFAAVAVYSALGFFLAEQVREMIMYATIFLAAFTVIVVTKLWYWMLANRNAIQRELKRLELRLANAKQQ